MSERKMAEELADAGRLANDELGEYWTALAGMWPRVADIGSPEFLEAYSAELRTQHRIFKEEFRIEEIEFTTTSTRRVLRDLLEDEE